mmetsp:Transcript_27412/g.41498  ORF Transcript_27412/g.41498 Transcript_27412/m.41498 type:complete len:695 (-) Transcript_27412:43-2127(-)
MGKKNDKKDAEPSLEDVQHRIVKLVSKHSKVNPSLLGEIYEEAYKHPLDYKQFGFRKLKDLLDTIFCIGLCEDEKTTYMIAITEKKPSKKEQKKKQAEVSFEDVQNRIINLVSKHSRVNQSLLGEMYKDSFKEPLDYKKFGFRKVKGLLDTISCIGPCEDPKTPYMLVIKKTGEGSKVVDYNGIDNLKELKESSSFSHSVSCPSLNSFFEFATNAKPTMDTNHSSSKGDSIEVSKPSNDDPVAITTPLISSLLRISAINNDLDSIRNRKLCLGNRQASETMEEMALLGHTRIDESNNDAGTMPTEEVYINTHVPFCLAAIGVQGAGKSHTLGCILESCLLSEPVLHDAIRLHKPMTAMVLHYDQSTTSVCEAAGLLSPKTSSNTNRCHVDKSKAVILVSPTYYKQRKAFYGEYCHVAPLLFRWSSLTADHIKRVMRITAEDNQLYVASFMSLLRRYQRKAVVPKFEQFINEVKEICNVKGQSGPLDQRIALLESMIAESKVNEDIISESMDLGEVMASNKRLIIVDLTDPLLSKDEANSLFQVVTEQFRSTPMPGSGKLLALDEAHKFMDGIKSDGLSEAIVNVARLMRHDGIRLAVSTQSPRALAPELLELVSVAVIHYFHSQNWWDYLCQKLPLQKDDFSKVLQLAPGNALTFASRHNIGHQNKGDNSSIINLWIRDRLTADFGASRTNRSE